MLCVPLDDSVSQDMTISLYRGALAAWHSVLNTDAKGVEDHGLACEWVHEAPNLDD